MRSLAVPMNHYFVSIKMVGFRVIAQSSIFLIHNFKQRFANEDACQRLKFHLSLMLAISCMPFFFFFFLRERKFQSMTSASDDSFLSSDQDTNQFLV